MKLSHKLQSCLALLALSAAPVVLGTVVTFTPNLTMADNDLTDVTDSRVLSGYSGVITDVNVSLNITGLPPNGAYNGDFSVYLTHSSGFSVLLNRIGTTAADALGFADDGLNVVLDDEAAIDIHVHTGGGTLPGALTGSWKPDGRNISPDAVVDTDPRTAVLSSFDGLGANGTWTLKVTDASQGFQGVLKSWSLDLAGILPTTTVPDSALPSGMLAGMMGICFAARRRLGSRV